MLQMSLSCRVKAVLGLCISFVVGGLAVGKVKHINYILISSPSTRNVYYTESPSFHFMTLPTNARPEPAGAAVLINGEESRCKGESCNEDADKGLKKPQGLAVHQGENDAMLYVADEEADNIYAYELAGGGPSLLKMGQKVPLTVGRQRLVREGVGGVVYGMTVDGQGNLYYTVDNGQIEMLRAEELASGTKLSPVSLYTSQQFDTISSPSGIASDGFHVYWTNQAGGGSSGSVTSAPATPGEPQSIAANGAGAVGICLARSNVFYTGEAHSLFAVKQSGGAIAEVSSGFQKPRGCAYDGDGSLLIADQQANAVYSLAAVSTLRSVRHRVKVASVQDPSQVAVYSGMAGSLHGPSIGSSLGQRSTRPDLALIGTSAILVLSALSYSA